MFENPGKNECTYEVGVYNQEVRSLVKENASHPQYGDRWADEHFQDVVAASPEQARQLARKKFPKERGFVISSLTPRVREI